MMNAVAQRGRRTILHKGGSWDARLRFLHLDALDYFRSVMGDRGVITAQDALAGVNTDWTGNFRGEATAVLAPASTAEVSKVLSYCNDHRLPVVPMGGNTGLTGGAVSSSGEAVLSFARMNNILGFQEVRLGHHASPLIKQVSQIMSAQVICLASHDIRSVLVKRLPFQHFSGYQKYEPCQQQPSRSPIATGDNHVQGTSLRYHIHVCSCLLDQPQMDVAQLFAIVCC